MSHDPTRRAMMKHTGAFAAGAFAVGSTKLAGAETTTMTAPPDLPRPADPKLLFSVKIGMVQPGSTLTEKFALLKSIGYDGVELDSPSGVTREDVRRAREETGLPVHGVVDSVHWRDRLSSPDESTREKGIAALEGAIRDSHAYGGSSVLLVPGRVANAETENHDQVWVRSIEGIRRVLPVAAELGIHILIENVWNGFCYQHDGPSDQTADQLAAYIDAVDSPWVGAYFDLGNHRKYGVVEDWVRTLGRRIVKLDVKDWGVANGWSKIGDGDVNWPAVRDALRDVGFHGWCTAEVGGGDAARLEDIFERMNRALRG